MTPFEQAEIALLGVCLMQDEVALDLAISEVTPEIFSLDSNKRIFMAIRDMNARGISPNLVTLMQELHTRGELEMVGYAYVSDLTSGLPWGGFPELVRDLINRLREFYRRRALASLGEQIGLLATDASVDSNSLIQTATTRLEAIVSDSPQEESSVDSFTVAALEKWNTERKGEQSPGLSFGVPDLDAATGGMMPGEQTALGAASGVGKTTALAQALYANASQGVPCHAFLLEPTREQILRRLWSIVADVRYGAAMKPWTANATESDRLRVAAYQVGEWPLRLHDRSTITLDQVIGLARLSINRHGTRLVALDYIQRLKIRQTERDEPLRLRVARASTALADLVKGTNCHSLLLSQLTTGRKNGAQAKPTMYDFRESSQIENDAHTIILLHRTYDEEQGHFTSDGAIFVPKQRFGSPCNLRAYFDPKMALWRGAESGL